MYTISGAFVQALQSSGHTIRVRMDVLDTAFNVIHQFHDIAYGDDATDILVDGNVDADVTRLTRRTFTANVLNPDGIWSPGSDWGGMFYVNRMIRLWRGIDFGAGYELVPIGTFLIDSADVEVERSMSVVSLSGSDLWKKFGKSAFSGAKSWPSGTGLNTIISYMASASGITKMNLDPLSNRAAGDRELSKTFAVERGDNRGEALARLATAHGIDVYFDVLGRLTTQDFSAPGDKAVVYEYGPQKNNNLITVKASFTDDNLYNAVLVVGTGDKDHVVTFRVRDTDPNSVTSVAKIGERVFIYETDSIKTTSVAEATALRLFYQKVLVNEDITLETICNPAFEGNDVIRVVETEYSGLNSTFRIKAFTVPMSTSRQTIRLLREIKLT
jgi:hypothetical protein